MKRVGYNEDLIHLKKNCVQSQLLQIHRQGQRQVGDLPPLVSKLSFLKTAAFVLNFKLCSPLINAWPPKSTVLASVLFTTFNETLIKCFTKESMTKIQFKQNKLIRKVGRPVRFKNERFIFLHLSREDGCWLLTASVVHANSSISLVYFYILD